MVPMEEGRGHFLQILHPEQLASVRRSRAIPRRQNHLGIPTFWNVPCSASIVRARAGLVFGKPVQRMRVVLPPPDSCNHAHLRSMMKTAFFLNLKFRDPAR